MTCPVLPRRTVLLSALALPLASTFFTSSDAAMAQSEKPKRKSERLGVDAIGLRYQGSVIAHKAQLYSDIVAVCDVDRHVRDQAKAAFGRTAQSFEDYRDLLARVCPETGLNLGFRHSWGEF